MRGPLLFVPPLIGVAVLAGALAMATRSEAGAERQIEIRFSRFEPVVISVKAGEPVTFVLQNNDPIEHEWIVGIEAVHERHRLGTEAEHDQISTEVTIPAFATRKTSVTFVQPGEYRFICHLPGHEAYGMSGTIIVLP